MARGESDLPDGADFADEIQRQVQAGFLKDEVHSGDILKALQRDFVVGVIPDLVASPTPHLIPRDYILAQARNLKNSFDPWKSRMEESLCSSGKEAWVKAADQFTQSVNLHSLASLAQEDAESARRAVIEAESIGVTEEAIQIFRDGMMYWSTVELIATEAAKLD